ncbi:MAG: hypothetical protein NW223_03650 [Hyphomicrobiaceae bacterium]|nr:hypothetical protein [Hyphomicrobiaceae bacterium]
MERAPRRDVQEAATNNERASRGPHCVLLHQSELSAIGSILRGRVRPQPLASSMAQALRRLQAHRLRTPTERCPSCRARDALSATDERIGVLGVSRCRVCAQPVLTLDP